MSEKDNDDICPPFPIDLQEFTMAIVGLGLMGGSLAEALHGKCHKVIGVDQSIETVSVALERKMIDYGTTDLVSGVREAHAVILAVPVRAIIKLLDQISPYLPEDCFVMDLGSTKSAITKKMENLPGYIHAIGGHPMCGKEVSGIKASDPLIYKKALFILTPLSKPSEYAMKVGMEIVETIGGRALILDPARHDQLVAMVSHLPYLLACGLVASTGQKAQKDKSVWDIAASGFWDTSRLAASDVTMMVDIIMTNRSAVLDAIDNFELSLTDIRKFVEAEEENHLRVILSSINYLRKTMIQKL